MTKTITVVILWWRVVVGAKSASTSKHSLKKSSNKLTKKSAHLKVENDKEPPVVLVPKRWL